MQEQDVKIIIEQLVDYLFPELSAFEFSLYLYLLRNSYLKDGSIRLRIGKRTIAKGCGKGAKGEATNYKHISTTLKNLEKAGCIIIGDTNRDGTEYMVNLPNNIPSVVEKMATITSQQSDEDYYSDAENRRAIYERDGWVCQYCGENVSDKNATIDHVVPQSKGGANNKENLKTCCMMCNSIKSGMSYEEAAPLLLASIRDRKQRSTKM